METIDNISGTTIEKIPARQIEKQEPQQVVIVYFKYGSDDWEPFYNLEDKLRKVITENNVGEYDGHELAMDDSDGFIYMYAWNAEVLFKTVKPVLDTTDFMKGAIANLWFGPVGEGVSEIEVEIGVN